MKTIVITGPSGSGKSHLAKKLYNDLNNAFIIKTDSYYRDNLLIKILSIFIIDLYDRIISIKEKEIIKTINSIYNKKKSIKLINYDFRRRKSSHSITSELKGTKFLIIEGIFSHRLNIDYKNTMNIFCRQKKEICYLRRLKRDQLERGRKRKEIKKKFSKSWYLFFKKLHVYINTYKVSEMNPDNRESYRKLITNIKSIKKMP